eukprot:57048-Eustigmatos_ZCMA.PRE.1
MTVGRTGLRDARPRALRTLHRPSVHGAVAAIACTAKVDQTSARRSVAWTTARRAVLPLVHSEPCAVHLMFVDWWTQCTM